MSDQGNREDTIVDAALELPPEERAAYLDQACGNDAGLRQMVEGMLRAYQRIDAPRAFANVTTRVDPRSAGPPVEQAGDRVGRYKLLQQIGEGGYGTVYMAEQEEPVRRRVALKVVKLGMDTKQVVARFEAERQALALMDHPNIAKVLDAGATETGRPYFVMELVRGIRITDYCDQNSLSTASRLDLFVQVCNAVQHAHQKGIIHRDIKPSNILVTLHDGVPVPKIIDFGIAKAIAGQRLTDQTVFTAFEQFIGTPAYMSPEQAEMSGLDIDTRSDIYALGVLLYELLTGKTPFDAKRFVSAALDELRRIIREEEPPRPSTRLSKLEAAEQTTVAKRRQSEPPKLVHLLSSDLDWIAMKCLEKDRTRRYETANALAGDVERHLQNEPVLARPPSRWYRLQKTVRRNKVLVAAGSAVALSLLCGLGLSTWLFVKEKKARQLADHQHQRSEQLATLLKDAFQAVTPGVALGEDTKLMNRVMEEAVKRAETDLSAQPDLEADLRNVVGEVYRALGEYDKAEAMHRRARDLLGKPPVANQDALATTFEDLGRVLRSRSKFPEAEQMHREALEMRRKLFGNDNMKVAYSLNSLGLALQNEGKLQDAEDSFRATIVITEKLKGEDDLDLAIARDNFATFLAKYRGKFDEAEELELKALAVKKKTLPRDHPDIATAVHNLAQIYAARADVRRDDLEKAERLHLEALAMREKVYPGPHPEVANSMENLALVLRAKASKQHSALAPADSAAQLKEAEDLETRALAMRQKVYSNPRDAARPVSIAFGNLGLILMDEGRLADAEAAFRKSLSAIAVLGEQHRMYADTIERPFTNFLDCLVQQGKGEEIETVSKEVLTPALEKTAQGARMARARDRAKAQASKKASRQ
jgi:serine/threonine protein kinase